MMTKNDPEIPPIDADEAWRWQIAQLADGTLAEADVPAVAARLESDADGKALLGQELRLNEYLAEVGHDVPGVDWEAQAGHISALIAESAEREGLVGGEALEWPAAEPPPGRWRIEPAVPVAAAASLAIGLLGGWLAFGGTAGRTPQVPAGPDVVAVERPAATLDVSVGGGADVASAAGAVEVEVGRPGGDTARLEPSAGVVERPSRVEIEVQ